MKRNGIPAIMPYLSSQENIKMWSLINLAIDENTATQIESIIGQLINIINNLINELIRSEQINYDLLNIVSIIIEKLLKYSNSIIKSTEVKIEVLQKEELVSSLSRIVDKYNDLDGKRISLIINNLNS